MFLNYLLTNVDEYGYSLLQVYTKGNLPGLNAMNLTVIVCLFNDKRSFLTIMLVHRATHISVKVHLLL